MGRGRSFRTRSSETAHPPSPAETHRIRPYGRFAAQAAGVEVAADGGTRARINGENAAVAARALRRACRSRPSIPRSTSSWTRARSAGAAGWTGWCSTWNQPLALHWARYNRALEAAKRRAASRGREVSAWDARADPERRWPSPKLRQRTLERLIPCLEQTLRALRGPGRHGRVHDRLAGWHIVRGGAAHTCRARSSSGDDDRRATSGRRHASPESSHCPRDAIPRAAEAHGRGDDRVAAAAAPGRARTCAPYCFWTTRRRSWMTKICSDCSKNWRRFDAK